MSLPLDVPVKLKSEYANVYSLAAPGAVGFARRRKEEEGFPMVFIEWDQQHWSYSGEQDKWTFENHFEPLDGDLEEDSTVSADEEGKLPPELQKGIEELFAGYLADNQPEQTQVQAAPDSELFELETPEEYQQTIEIALKAAADGIAFLMIGVAEREIDDGGKALVPYVVSSYTNETAGLFLETQVADFAASAFQNTAVALMTRIRREHDERTSNPEG